MKVTKQKENKYQISGQNLCLTLSISISRNEIIIFIQDNKSENISYKVNLTFEALIGLNKKYKEFENLEDVSKGIASFIESGEFKIKKKEDHLTIFIFLLGNIIIPLFKQEKLPVKTSAQLDSVMNEKEPIITDDKIVQIMTHMSKYKKEARELEKMLTNSHQFNRFQSKDFVIPTRLMRILYELPSLQIKKIIKERLSSISSILILKDGRLGCCCSDSSIKIFELNSMKLVMIIKGHSGGVRHIVQLDNEYLVSSSGDKTIKIWRIFQEYYEYVETLSGHKGFVLKTIQLSKGRMASCSSDGTIKVWNWEQPFNIIKTLSGHTAPICSIIELKNKKYIVSGSYDDKSLKFWDTQNYKCEHNIDNVTCWFRNSLLEVEDNRIIVGGLNEVTIINFITFQVENKIHFFEEYAGSILCFLELNEGNILCGCESGTLALIDINIYQLLSVKDEAHKGYITGLIRLNDFAILSSSFDKSIKLWIFK